MALPSSPPSVSSSGAGRGHLIVKSHRPLPRFVCAIPVPPPSAPVEALRNTVVAIISGKVSADGDGQAGGARASDKDNGALSYSEHLKQQTIHEWRCKSILLELKQNAMIAPETREQQQEAGNVNGELDGPGAGFELTDEHDCALLEHGDEVNVWLRGDLKVESLRLPRLSSRHKFGLPNQPAISRSGLLLDSDRSSPHIGSSDDAEYLFEAVAARIRKPTEPSSHSSSVQGNPEGQFETTMRHRAAANGQRILVLGEGGVVKGAGGDGIYRATAEAPRLGARSKPRRMMSEGAKLSTEANVSGLPANAAQGSAPRPARRAGRAQSSGLLTTVGSTPRNASASSPPPTTTTAAATASSSQAPLASPPISNRDVILATQSPPPSAPSRTARQKSEQVRMAGQKGMPAQALIVGPGVQGKVGRMNSMPMDTVDDSTTVSSAANGAVDRKMDAFVAFTAAGSEMHQSRRPSETTRRVSSRSGLSDKQNDRPERSRRPSETRMAGSGGRASLSTAVRDPPSGAAASNGQKSRSLGKQFVKVPPRPDLPPVRNLLPFEGPGSAGDTFPPMPMPAEKVPSVPSMPDIEQDAAIAQALSEALNYESPPSSPINTKPVPVNINDQEHSATQSRTSLPLKLPGEFLFTKANGASGTTSSGSPSEKYKSASASPFEALAHPPAQPAVKAHSTPPNGDTAECIGSVPGSSQAAVGEDGDPDPSTASTPLQRKPLPKTKAERRYEEVQLLLETERKKQRDAEEARRAGIAKAEEEKHRLLDKLEEERRQKLEKLRWQMWDEVRNRQARQPTK